MICEPIFAFILRYESLNIPKKSVSTCISSSETTNPCIFYLNQSAAIG